MRAMTMRLAAALWALLWLLPAGAQTDAATAETLLRKSGLWAQLASTAQQVRSGLADTAREQGAELTPTEVERLSRVIDAAYAAPRLRAAARRVVMRDLPRTAAPPLLAWFDSATGRLMTRLEEQSNAVDREPDASMREGARRLAAMGEGRRLLLERLMVESRASEAMAGMTINTALGVQQGLRSARPDLPGPGVDELRAALQGQRAQMEQAYAGFMLATAAAVYAEASDEQLQAYLRFHETDAGRVFTRVIERALDELFLEAATELGRALPGTKDQANT